ncbi:Drug/metabolite transporter [Corchorus olitorius]|uniref:Drug/metabolite transporter n=1 Tax=Corchorus olitorius TaxID=93759 RepID=A0A1R3KU86_9ROSI|nr:Drug/metabolite transporter [Corchorus olitorius]
MGVHGLWELLAPVGRRVSVETLAGKKLAIDASIWMVQFMKAMRDEKGEMVRNAHLLGFFRRICKLLFLRTKPVFVFDGATPVLKRRTVIARRRQRENAQAKIRKTAEKLLLNHLKQMRLKELAKDLENQRKMQKSNGKAREVSSDKQDEANDAGCNANVELTNQNHVKLKEILVEPISAKDEDGGNNESEDEDDEIILPEIDGNIDPDVLAVLPKSMQRQLLSQNDVKGKKSFSDDLNPSNMEKSSAEHDSMASSSYDQEKLDEMLAASLGAEEDINLANNASTSAAAILSDEDGDEGEEMILPATHGDVDPAVLAALPPSLQLDLLVQVTEPEKFSELQIQSYLKTVAFRREIDEVQRAAAGRGLAGVQTSRIASEANKEFIFSSSFTGDKQALTSARKERDEDKPQEVHSNHTSGSFNSVKSVCKSNMVKESAPNEPNSAPDEDVGTYLDERGRVRVSRVRSMGIRMTRDLQRNLDLMKEVEQERTNSDKSVKVQSVPDRNIIGTSNSLSRKNHIATTSLDGKSESVNISHNNQQSAFEDEAFMEITFEDDGRNTVFDNDDDIFARLAAGDPVTLSSLEDKSPRKQASDSDSDCEWEEDTIEGKWVSHGENAEINPSKTESHISGESEVEWEEEPSDAQRSSVPVESGRLLSKGYLQEESDLHEAIRRSLADVGAKRSNYLPSDLEKPKILGENMDEGFGSLQDKNYMDGPSFQGDNLNQQTKSQVNSDGFQKLCSVDYLNLSETINSPERLSPIAHNSDKNGTLIKKPCERSDVPHSGQSRQNDGTELVSTLEKEVHFQLGKCLDSSNEVDGLSTVSNCGSKDSSHSLDVVIDNFPGAVLVDKKNVLEGESSTLVIDQKSSIGAEPCVVPDENIDFEAKSLDQPIDIVDSSIPLVQSSVNNKSLDQPIDIVDLSIPLVQSSVNKVTFDTQIEREIGVDRTYENRVNEAEQEMGMFTIKGNDSAEIEFPEATLDEELLILDQERMNLGDEQRKLERNVESVSSEMFAECQELLQMFGIPYIIAPMEAEAQCAYIELTNLVDGVVTDDSDVFLFGARSVYKNIFDDRKYVETYFMQDIEKELGLTREMLIRMALLLGSDYTEGISGIGIVNAIEVVNAFPEEDGLHKFREWVESPDPTILGKLNVQEGSSGRKRGSKSSEKDNNTAEASDNGGVSSLDEKISQADKIKHSTDCNDDVKQVFMDKHRNVSKNWHIPSSFPSAAVISEYSSPRVDKSTEPFTWGRPDLFVLRKLCWEKFGWGSQKSDELLLPVLREYEKRETQLRLEAFYTFNERFAKIRSKRIKKAVRGIAGKLSLELIDDATKGRKKRQVNPVESGDDQSGEPSNRKEERVSRSHSKSMEKSVPKPSRKRQNPGKHVPSGMNCPGSPLEVAPRGKTKKQSPSNGRGRGCGVKRRCKASPEPLEGCSPGADSGKDYQAVDGEKLEMPLKVRRSMRTRNPVDYAVDDREDEDGLSNKEASCGRAKEQGAADDLNEKNLSQVHVPSLEEDSSRDYLERGGGFCMDEQETGQPDASQDVDHSSEAEASMDYLNMGGGFCMEESETTKDLDAAYCQDPIGVTESSNIYASTDKADDNIGSAELSSGAERFLDGLQYGVKTPKPIAESDIDHRNAANKDDSEDKAPLQDTGTEFIGGLKAMPTLKRKRRKSRQTARNREEDVKNFQGEKMGLTSYIWKAAPFVAMITVECTDVGISVISKAALTKGMSNTVSVVYYNALGTLILLPYVIFFRNKQAPLTLSLLWRFFLLGLIGSSGQIVYLTGVKLSSPTLSSALVNLIPIFTFLLAVTFRMEKLEIRRSSSQAKALGAIVAVTGAFVVTLYKGPAVLKTAASSNFTLKLIYSDQSKWILGGFLIVLVCLTSASWNIFQTATVKAYPDKMTIVFFYTFFITIQSLVFSAIVERNSTAWKVKSTVEVAAIVFTCDWICYHSTWILYRHVGTSQRE